MLRGRFPFGPSSSFRLLALLSPLLGLPRDHGRLSSLPAAAASAAEPPKHCKSNRENNKFLHWLRSKAGAEISSVLSIGHSDYGRSLFALVDINAGDCILEVPYDAQFMAEKISLDVDPFINHEVGELSLLALALIIEQKLGEDSGWVTYVSSLPCIDDMHNTTLWSKDELQLIRQSQVYNETLYRQAHIEKEFSALRPAIQHYYKVLGQVDLHNFIHAYALDVHGRTDINRNAIIRRVTSRAWETSNGISLIPFADFLNHNGTSAAVLLSDPDKRTSEVIADQKYSAGEEVCIRYGKFSNAELLLNFGFTFPYNIYDQAQLWMYVPPHDPLSSVKMELLQKHCWPRIKEKNVVNSTGRSFIIKEVKSNCRKGKGIPLALRAFARIVSASSNRELEALVTEAVKHDGRLARRSLEDRKWETEAHRILYSQFMETIRGHEVSLKELDSWTAADTDSRVAIRVQMARDLLKGELRVLQSASTWLENYCASLSATG